MLPLLTKRISTHDEVRRFDRDTSADSIAAVVDRVRSSGSPDQLIPLLSERHAVYCDRSTNETVRLRGYAMAAFRVTGLPARALPYVLESLESSFHPYMVAAAARALCGMKQPHPRVSPFLVKAIYNIWQSDNPVSFASFNVEWPLKEFTTAVAEIAEALTHLGSHAESVLPDLSHIVSYFPAELGDENRHALRSAIDAIEGDEREPLAECCELPPMLQLPEEEGELKGDPRIPMDLIIEDQDASKLKWREFFTQKPTILAFFYTRCANPRKCTQTILNLAAIQRELEQTGLSGRVRLAAVTYDPRFDTPQALKCYGESRKLRFDADSRMFRVPQGFEEVVRSLRLGVNFMESQVNSHRVELFLLNETGAVVDSFLRIQCEPRQVVAAVESIVSPDRSVSPRHTESDRTAQGSGIDYRTRTPSFVSAILALLVAFFPKCPMCWISYMSVMGIGVAESVPYSPWLLPVIVVLLFLNLSFQYRSAQSRNGFVPFFLSLAGSVLLVLSAMSVASSRWVWIPGLTMIWGASLLQALSYSTFNRLKLFCLEFRYRLRSAFLRLHRSRNGQVQ